MSASSDNEDEYVAKIADDVLSWIEELACKGVEGFKLPECKEKFMVIPINRLSDACEHLVKKNRIVLDPSSRRIAAYTIHPSFMAGIEKKKAETEAADAKAIEAAKAARAKVIEAARAAHAKQAEQAAKAQEEERALKRAELESKKAKAAAAAGPLAKKQKVDDTLGTKKIFSFFKVQSAIQSTLAAHVASLNSTSSAADENTAPLARTGSSANLTATHSSEESQEETSACSPTPVKKPIAPAAAKFQIVDLMPTPAALKVSAQTSSSGEGGEGALSVELQDLIMTLIPEAFVSNGGSMHVASLLQRCVEEHGALHPEDAPLQEAQLQSVLRTLEGRNVIMIDDGVIYEV
jgi:hypothetical protein